MEILRGECASGGVAFGRIKILNDDNKKALRRNISSVSDEIKRFNDAVEKTKERLEGLYEETLKKTNEQEAEIFQIHYLMLEDKSLTECCESIIYEQSVNAEYALDVAADIMSEMLTATNDEYMMARVSDIEDIKRAVLTELTGKSEQIELEENTILFARDLTPSQTVKLDKEKIAAFVTEKGAKNSHAAILARSMKIPTLVNVKGCLNENFNEKDCVVDAESEEIMISPDEDTKKEFLNKREEIKKHEESLIKLKGQETKTRSGKKIKLYANISTDKDIEKVIENDAEGIGLFRSEFLYIGKKELPDEETQFLSYKRVLETMNPKEVIIRTLDIGADKKAECMNLGNEENPALGYRAIRICLNETEIFKTQIRALLRASVFGNLLILIPMITSEEEIISAIDIINDVKCELTKENILYKDNIPIGAMIETPAAALISENLAKHVDFFSIGTNDLTQYTLACDRQNERVSKTYNPHHEAIYKLIKMTCDAARKKGIWVGVCGELASDKFATSLLLEAGVDELSVSPPYVLALRERIINHK